MKLTYDAIEQFIVHELSAIRYEERRLSAALARASRENARGVRDAILRALARLEERTAELDAVLEQAFPSERLHAA